MTEPQDPTETPAPPEKQSNRHRWLFGIRAMLLVAMLPIVFCVIAAVTLVGRDIAAPSWIKTRIEERVALVLNGGTIRFGEIYVHIGRDLHPRVRLLDTQLQDADGVTIARVRSVRGLMSPRGLVLQREVLMQDIALTGAQINLRRAKDGSVAVAFDNAGNEVGQAPSLTELLDQADQLFEQPALEALERVRADGLIVNFDDARARRSWIVDGGVLELDLRDDKTMLRGDLSLLSGRAEVTTVAISYESPRGSREASLSVKIDDAIAGDLAAQSPALNWLSDIEAPISAALRTQLDSDGALGPLSATLEIGKGALQPNAATKPVQFDSAKAYLTYDPAIDQIAFDQVSLETEWGRMQASGRAYLRDFDNGLPGTLLAQFNFRDVEVNPADMYDTPLAIPSANVDLRLRFDPFTLEVGQLVVDDEDMKVSAHGDITATDAGWRVAMDLAIDRMAQQKVLTLWPVAVKPRTRVWFSTNVTQGTFFNIEAGLRLAPDRPAKFSAGMEFEDATVRFLRNVPPITGGAGFVSFIDSTITVSADKGTVSAPEGGRLDVAGTVFAIPNVRMRDAPAFVELEVSSSITAALSVLNQPPFEFLDKANLPVTIADGRAEVAGEISLLMKPKPTKDEVSFDIDATLNTVRSDILVPGRRLVASRLSVHADRAGLTISGPLRIGAVAASGTWSQQFGPDKGGRSSLDAEIELSERFLEEFNIALPPGSISGSGTGQLRVDLRKNEPPSFSLTSNLRGVRVALPPIGWSKPRNARGQLVVEGTLGTVPQIRRLEISGGGLTAKGRIDMKRDGTLDAARFSQVSVGDWLNAPITLNGRGRGQPVGVVINGGTLDLRRARFGAGGGDSGPLQIALDRLQVTQGIALTAFRGNFNGSGGFSGQFNANVNGATAIQGTVASKNGRSAVRLLSDDAGGVARAAGFIRNAIGGSFDLTLLPAGGEGTFDGILAIRGLRVRDAPSIAALLDAISVVGLLQQLDGQGLSFDEVDARFRLTPSQVVLTEASAVGPGLGISLDGIYTLASKQIDFQGVVSPFYLINSIGSVLTRKGEGLIGFNFNIAGSVDAPRVSVNPLSALTPGMFRDIFRRPAPQVSK